MRYADAVKTFKKEYLNPGVYDYWTVEEMWSSYTDYLCKSGQITNRQFSTWSTPFEYGKMIHVFDTTVVAQKKAR